MSDGGGYFVNKIIRMKTKIGIDIVGVLADDKKPFIRAGEYVIFSLMKDAIEVVGRIVNKFGAENVFIVSRVTSHQTALATGIWMETHQFLQKTKLPLENVHLCTRHGEKTEVAKKLGITHFIDNKLNVLDYFDDNVELLAFRVEKSEAEEYPGLLQRIIFIDSWQEIADYFEV